MRIEDLLNGRPLATFTAAQLAERAQARWDRGELDAAYLLFCAAADAAPRDSGPDRTIVYLARAAMTRHEAGDDETARALFDQVIAFDWRSAGTALMSDAHVVEWAFASRLERVRDAAAFHDLYARAVRRCAELGWVFPRIHPKQDALLDHALRLRCEPVVRVLVDRIAARRPSSRITRDRLEEAQRWLAGRAGGR